MTRHVTMQWNLRQVMADRGIFQTSELLPLLQQRGVNVSREHVYRLVTRTPQWINIDILAALCDALGCGADELLSLVVEAPDAGTGTAGLDSGKGPKLGFDPPDPCRHPRPGEE
jgi:DNA-binding Xre family transcriptional regulator